MKEEKCQWESRELGCDEMFVRVVSDEEMAKFNEILGLVDIKLRLSKKLKNELEEMAQKEGMNFQAFLRKRLSGDL